MGWQELAACKDDPHPECWWPGPGDVDDAARAVRVCLGCPVRAECLADALTHQVRHTIRGGLSERARLHLRQLLDA